MACCHVFMTILGMLSIVLLFFCSAAPPSHVHWDSKTMLDVSPSPMPAVPDFIWNHPHDPVPAVPDFVWNHPHDPVPTVPDFVWNHPHELHSPVPPAAIRLLDIGLMVLGAMLFCIILYLVAWWRGQRAKPPQGMLTPPVQQLEMIPPPAQPQQQLEEEEEQQQDVEAILSELSSAEGSEDSQLVQVSEEEEEEEQLEAILFELPLAGESEDSGAGL